MTASEKHREEQEILKKSRMTRIFEAAFDLFSENGIDAIAINDIAKKAEIGVASLYRYFSTKEELAIETAVYAWKMEEDLFRENFSSPEYDSLSGFEQVKTLLEVFLEALVTQESFFRFVYHFDSFVKREKLTPEKLIGYENTISVMRTVVVKALEKGENDGSIVLKPCIDGATNNELYFTMMHSLFSLAQKLSLSGEMLYMDLEVSAIRQVELLINIILNSLQKS